MRCHARFACCLSVVLACPTLLVSTTASAHGGLPISEQIVFQGDTLVVPTKYWGVFLGTDGGDWRWICEEAINQRQDRIWALGKSGAYYVTDYAGITSSRDEGCTWEQSTGEIQRRSTSDVVADPQAPHRAWATTDESIDEVGGWNALFRTDDDGQSWTPVLQVPEYLRGVALSPDGQRVYVTGMGFASSSGDGGTGGVGDGGDAGTSDADVKDAGATGDVTTLLLHVSSDGGQHFDAVPLAWKFCPTDDPATCYVPVQVTPMAVDPRDADTVYLRVDAGMTAVLLAAHPDGSATELLRTQSTIYLTGIPGLEFDVAKDEMYVAARSGFYRRVGDGPLEPLGNLSQAQCAVRHGDALYACSWNYDPDNAAIARSDDDGAHFVPVFQYAATCGPVTTCGPQTSVGMTCPNIWMLYADQLGANADGGCGGSATKTQGGCGCSLGARTGDEETPIAGFALLVGALLLRALFRRRRWTA